MDALYLTDVVISSNNAGSSSSGGQPNTKGGGAYIESDLLVLDNVQVSGNSSKGRPSAFGGGLYVVSDEVRKYNTTINGNSVITDQYVGSSTATAGGAYIDADSIYLVHCNVYVIRHEPNRDGKPTMVELPKDVAYTLQIPLHP